MTRSFLAFAAIALFATLPACRALNQPGGNLTLTSLSGTGTLAPAIRAAVYKRIDDNTADLYFSDIPESRLTDGGDNLGDASGVILHIHFFLEPSAGNTPIDDTACNATIRSLVLAPGADGTADSQVIGVYGGGGFLFPSGSPGSRVFGGSMRDGTHRLLGSTTGFRDALGPASLSGKLLAVRDDAAADIVQRKMRVLLRRVPVSAPKPTAETESRATPEP